MHFHNPVHVRVHTHRNRAPAEPVDLASIDVSPRVQQLFRSAVLKLAERRRLPCNISCINDIMRQEDRFGC